MSPLAWLLGLVLPACAYAGAQGLAVPPVMDFSHLGRPASPNTALAAPAGFQPPPDLTTPPYSVSAERLYAAVSQIAAAQPRSFPASAYPDRLQLHFVVRSAVLNFPDLVTAQVSAAGPAASTLVLYSRSVYGYSDLGVNRQRLITWLAALNAAMPPATK
jgi:uncharacterized protein (DUF1499 family)